MNTTEPISASTLADPLSQPQRRMRLLVVDDQKINIQIMNHAFGGDHQVFMAMNGEQALAVCASKQPDLVLLDVEMPGASGYEVCRQLKSDAATRDIPIIFVTAHTDEEAETRGLDAGAVDFITKPINPKIVRARVKTHLTLKLQSDQLRQWVYLDGLTGAYNRRHFDEKLATEWARATRNGTALCVLMIDIDYFKRYNDHYGHQEGDNCLRQVAMALKAGVQRPADLVARYGGEEFACILPETEFSGAMVLANMLEQRVRGLQVAHEASAVDKVVTISLGVSAKAPGRNGDPAGLLASADTQLYRAKTSGRGRACGEPQDSGAPPAMPL